MSEIIALSNLILAIGCVVLFLGSAILIFDYKVKHDLKAIIARWGLLFAFLLTAGSTIMTLIYSEVFGFTPCGLCWLQRIFLYPQAFILGTAVFAKDKTAALYGIVLSIPGLIIALYQHYLQMGGSEFVTCPTTYGGDCAERTLFEFGFVTFPLMSASLFLFLIVLYFYIRKTKS